MKLDLATLQLVVNVVMITGVTSLAVICHLLRRDNQKLNNDMNLRCQQAPIKKIYSAPETLMPEPRADVFPEQDCVAALHALSITHPDIRRYVARRAQEWTPQN